MRRRANSKLSITTDASLPSSVMDASIYAVSTHSRESSSASDNYSPLTPTFSVRDHARMASSNSSLASTPPSFDCDSPSATGKTVLDDLVEEPSEREEGQYDVFTDMRKLSTCSSCQAETPDNFQVLRPSLDYNLADGFCSENDLSLRTSRKRSGSGDSNGSPVNNLASRMVNRFPSLSRRLTNGRPTMSVNTQGIRSAPISRAPSFRLPSLTKSLVNHIENCDLASPPPTPVDPVQEGLLLPPTTMPVEVVASRVEEPIDRKAFSSTPLLPPLMTERPMSQPELLSSPLQSPTVANTFHISASADDLTLARPTLTPPLSAKPSLTELQPSCGAVQVGVESDDKWAKKLGHANFGILPEPYVPSTSDARACKQLTDDWELARRQYLNHAAHTSENYGPTSQTFKFTELKWAEIDAQWKRNHEIAISNATAKGESPINQPLAESAPLQKMPSIDGPESQGKFPLIENEAIVGPMVQYAKIQTRPSKRSTILKFLRSPTSRP